FPTRRSSDLGYPREFFATAWSVKLGVMLLLVEVERSNVFATFTIWHEEDDLTPKSPGPRHCLVEDRRPIRGADEHDVPGRSLQSRNAKWNPCAVEADHPR